MLGREKLLIERVSGALGKFGKWIQSRQVSLSNLQICFFTRVDWISGAWSGEPGESNGSTESSMSASPSQVSRV